VSLNGKHTLNKHIKVHTHARAHTHTHTHTHTKYTYESCVDNIIFLFNNAYFLQFINFFIIYLFVIKS